MPCSFFVVLQESTGGRMPPHKRTSSVLDGAANAAPARRRRVRRPRIGPKFVAASLVVLLSLGLFGVGGWMIWQHQRVIADQQRAAEFAAAARQGVVTLMSLDFNHAEDDVKRILDNTTGDFRKDFESQAPEFTDVAKQSKVVTEATVNAAAVQSMTKDTATVLVAVTTRVSNPADNQQAPRSWRLSVDVVRDGGQVKLAKVEFVP
jgi:Mce-associated membrane protein